MRVEDLKSEKCKTFAYTHRIAIELFSSPDGALVLVVLRGGDIVSYLKITESWLDDDDNDCSYIELALDLLNVDYEMIRNWIKEIKKNSDSALVDKKGDNKKKTLPEFIKSRLPFFNKKSRKAE
jgi:hypothetical protein